VFKDYANDVERPYSTRNYYDRVQIDSQCCGYLLPEDWLNGGLHYIPSSCCKFAQMEQCSHLGVTLDGANLTQLSLAEAHEIGCFAKERDRENSANMVAYLFFGGITGSGLILQLIGLITTVAYKLTNFSIIMRPTYSTHL
jgi:hypothetical protein